MNKEENLLAQIRWIPGSPNPNGEYGLVALHNNKIKDAMFLLVNNGYRVEKVIRNDESLALSK